MVSRRPQKECTKIQYKRNGRDERCLRQGDGVGLPHSGDLLSWLASDRRVSPDERRALSFSASTHWSVCGSGQHATLVRHPLATAHTHTAARSTRPGTVYGVSLARKKKSSLGAITTSASHVSPRPPASSWLSRVARDRGSTSSPPLLRRSAMEKDAASLWSGTPSCWLRHGSLIRVHALTARWRSSSFPRVYHQCPTLRS